MSTLRLVARAFRLVRARSFSVDSDEGRSMERYRRVLMTSVGTVGARAVQLGVGLIAVPLVLSYLGKERYALWATVTALLPMLVFVYRGIGNGLVQALAEADGRDDTESAREYVATTFVCLSVVALAGSALFVALYGRIPWAGLFNVDDGAAEREVGQAVAVLVGFFCINMVLNVVHLVHAALQEGVVNSIVAVVASALSLLGMLLTIHFDLGLPGLIAAWAGAASLPTILQGARLFGWKRPWLRFGLRDASVTAARRVLRTGGYLVVVQLALAAGQPTDMFVGTHVLGADRVAEYAVAAKLFTMIQLPVMLVLGPLWPAYSEAVGRGDGAWAGRAFRRSTWLACAGSVFLSLPLVLFGRPLVRLWVGEDMDLPFSLLSGLALWTTLSVMGNNVTFFLAARNAVRESAMLSAVMFVLSVGARILAVRTFGLPGLPWATALTYGLVFLVPLALLVRRELSTISPLAEVGGVGNAPECR